MYIKVVDGQPMCHFIVRIADEIPKNWTIRSTGLLKMSAWRQINASSYYLFMKSWSVQ